MAKRLPSLTGAIAVLAAAVTVAAALAPDAFVINASDSHVAIETGASVVALLVAFLVLGRFLQDGSVRDLALAWALSVLGFGTLVFSVIPLAAEVGFRPWAEWSSMTMRLAAGVGFAVAAFVPQRRVRGQSEALRRAVLLLVAVIAVPALTFAFASPHLSSVMTNGHAPSARADLFKGESVSVIVMFAVTGALYALAAVGFAARGRHSGDPIMSWLATGSVFAAFASFGFILFPSIYSRWLFVGDYFRLFFYALLLLGVASQIQRYQRSVAEGAALEERRRLARELHDGLAQELAFIATQSRWLSRNVEQPETAEHLAVAAERALDESRSAISALTRPLDEPLDTALAQAAEDVARRVGVRLKLQLEGGIEVTPSTREALVRIVREAVSNTARHGHAQHVTVELYNRDGVRVRVGDDGIGFDPAERMGRGFGLTSMKERARALGGDLSVSSAPGDGTQIEVVIP